MKRSAGGTPPTIEGAGMRGAGDGTVNDVKMTHNDPEEVLDTVPKPYPNLNSTGLTKIGSDDIYQYSNGPTIAALTNYTDSGHQKDEVEEGDQTPLQQYASKKMSLPPSVAHLGLEFRPHCLKLEISDSNRNVQKGINDIDGGSHEVKCYSDEVYAKNCKILMNTLSNKSARNWAIHEFFCNDLDREWYQNDGFASDLAKLRLPISSKSLLTKQEWNIIRCKLRPRPRRFSKRFIADQIKKRNRHRNLVRKLQEDPNVIGISPISVGTIVTAYHKQGGTIHQGRILRYDSKNHNYLIQFDTEEYNCEICPDTDVSVSADSLSSVKRGDTTVASSCLYDSCKFFSNKDDHNYKEYVLSKKTTRDERVESIEREILISLIAAIKRGFTRKKNILQALETCSEIPSMCSSKHISWLLANLDRSNSMIQAASTHLKVLYGVTYEAETAEEDFKVKKMRLLDIFPTSKLRQELVTSLTSTSKKVGELIFSNTTFGDGVNKKRSSFTLEKDLSGSANLLLLTNYIVESSYLGSNAVPISRSMGRIQQVPRIEWWKNVKHP